MKNVFFSYFHKMFLRKINRALQDKIFVIFRYD